MALHSSTLTTILVLLLAGATLTTAESLDARAADEITQFSGTADEIANWDPHDYVPSHYWQVRVAHAALMSAVWLVIFPVGGMIPRLMRGNTNLIVVHAVIQMIGFWTLVAAAGMGIWMAKEIDQMTNYHPLIGMILLALLCVQPATEIINHRFYHINPRVIVAAHIHIWLGRTLLVAGVVQGGLGFLFAASFRKADTELWPRVAYGIMAAIMWIVYMVFAVIYPEIRGSREKKALLAQKEDGEAPLATPYVHNTAPMVQQNQDYQVNDFLYGYRDRHHSVV